MKLSKSLLQAILVGTTLGTISSCDLLEAAQPKDAKKENQTCNNSESIQTSTENTWANCPGCGGG